MDAARIPLPFLFHISISFLREHRGMIRCRARYMRLRLGQLGQLGRLGRGMQAQVSRVEGSDEREILYSSVTAASDPCFCFCFSST
jgi:hypothetical protein